MKKFYRSSKNSKIGGVCEGLAKLTNTDPIFWRVVFIAFLFTIIPAFLIYILLWIAIPLKIDENEEIGKILEDLEDENIKIYNDALPEDYKNTIKILTDINEKIEEKLPNVKDDKWQKQQLKNAKKSIIKDEIITIQNALDNNNWSSKRTKEFKFEIEELKKKL